MAKLPGTIGDRIVNRAKVQRLMPLPNFFVIGAAKAGTTALYEYLSEHPDVYMCPIKETNFFAVAQPCRSATVATDDDRFRVQVRVRTLADYEGLFEKVTTETAIGEACPTYLESPIAAERIHAVAPDAKIVVSLRHPVDRAYSGYLMALRNGRVKGSVEAELTESSHFVRVGYYHRLLEKYYTIFDNQNIYPILFDELQRDLAVQIRMLFNFLNVDENFMPDTRKSYNVGGVAKSKFLNSVLASRSLRGLAKPVLGKRALDRIKGIYTNNLERPPPLAAELRRQLVELYRDDILRLQDLIGRDLSSWLRIPAAD